MATLITIEGKVTRAADGVSLAGVKVLAYQEGAEVHQVTGPDGRFTLHLLPGLWRITVRAKGFNEPQAYVYNFTQDAAGIDFKLEEGYLIAGQVLSEETGKLAPGIVVTAEAEIDGQEVTRQELTGPGGKYTFAGLPPGRWTVQGRLGERASEKQTVQVGPDHFSANLILPHPMAAVDWKWGMAFFASLCGLVLLLAGVYLWAHSRYAAGPEPEYAALSGQVDQALQMTSAIQAKKEVTDQDWQPLRSAVAGVKENWEAVSGGLLATSRGQKVQISLLLVQAQAGVAAKDPQAIAAALNVLKAAVQNPRSTYFWAQSPASYLEVVFWSLAGVLVNLLVSVGYYLRLKRFYPEGIWMHLSHLLAVPLLALVVVFLLSQLKLTVQIDQSEVAIDIRDPRLLAALSFIIAINPWKMLQFIREAARRFFSQAQRRIGGQQAQAEV